VLCEEKDRLLENYGIIHCTAEALSEIEPKAIIGKKESEYGIEAMIERSYAPKDISVSPIDIEQLFVYMMRGEDRFF